MFSSWLCVDLVMQNTFKVECWQKRHVVIFQWMFCTFKVFCMLKSAQNIRCGHFFGSGRLRTWFQSVFARTHGNIWADAGPLKVKMSYKNPLFPQICHDFHLFLKMIPNKSSMFNKIPTWLVENKNRIPTFWVENKNFFQNLVIQRWQTDSWFAVDQTCDFCFFFFNNFQFLAVLLHRHTSKNDNFANRTSLNFRFRLKSENFRNLKVIEIILKVKNFSLKNFFTSLTIPG